MTCNVTLFSLDTSKILISLPVVPINTAIYSTRASPFIWQAILAKGISHWLILHMKKPMYNNATQSNIWKPRRRSKDVNRNWCRLTLIWLIAPCDHLCAWCPLPWFNQKRKRYTDRFLEYGIWTQSMYLNYRTVIVSCQWNRRIKRKRKTSSE